MSSLTAIIHDIAAREERQRIALAVRCIRLESALTTLRAQVERRRVQQYESKQRQNAVKREARARKKLG